MSGEHEGGDAVRISVNRKLFGAAAALLGVGAVVGVDREVAAGSVVMTLILGLGLGGMCAFYVRGLLRRGPAIVIDAEGLRDLRSGRAVRWASVSEILLRQRQGLFGEHHHLVLTVAGSTAAASELDISIDLLSMSWKTVVDAVEERAGRRVIVRRERGVVTR